MGRKAKREILCDLLERERDVWGKMQEGICYINLSEAGELYLYKKRGVNSFISAICFPG